MSNAPSDPRTVLNNSPRLRFCAKRSAFMQRSSDKPGCNLADVRGSGPSAVHEQAEKDDPESTYLSFDSADALPQAFYGKPCSQFSLRILPSPVDALFSEVKHVIEADHLPIRLRPSLLQWPVEVIQRASNAIGEWRR